MNLFVLALAFAVLCGAAGGVAASAGSGSFTFAACGALVGLLCYVGTIGPGVLVMRFAPGRGVEDSIQSTAGQWLLMIAGIGSPFAAFFGSRLILSWAGAWLR